MSKTATLQFQDKPQGVSTVSLARYWASADLCPVHHCPKGCQRWHRSISCLTDSPWHVLWLLHWGLSYLPLFLYILWGQFWHPLCWPKNSFKALWCSTQSLADKIRLKPVSTIRSKGERDQSDVFIGKTEILQWWRQRKLDCKTRGYASLSGWFQHSPGRMGFLFMLHSKQWCSSQCAPIFHILIIKMFSLPVMSFRWVKE